MESARLSVTRTYRLAPSYPRPDKCQPLKPSHLAPWGPCPTLDGRALALLGIVEVPRKSMRPSQVTPCSADRGRGLAPSRQRFDPSVHPVGYLRRDPLGHRCYPVTFPERV